MITPYYKYTNDELLSIVFTQDDISQLELELAHRLEEALIVLEGERR